MPVSPRPVSSLMFQTAIGLLSRCRAAAAALRVTPPQHHCPPHPCPPHRAPLLLTPLPSYPILKTLLLMCDKVCFQVLRFRWYTFCHLGLERGGRKEYFFHLLSLSAHSIDIKALVQSSVSNWDCRFSSKTYGYYLKTMHCVQCLLQSFQAWRDGWERQHLKSENRRLISHSLQGFSLVTWCCWKGGSISEHIICLQVFQVWSAAGKCVSCPRFPPRMTVTRRCLCWCHPPQALIKAAAFRENLPRAVRRSESGRKLGGCVSSKKTPNKQKAC